MSATEFLCRIIGINPQKFTKEENIFLEAELFARITAELEKFYKEKNIKFLRLIKSDFIKESDMREDNIVCCIVNDILLTKQYTLAGIALYTEIPEDVICDASLGSNKASSATLLRKVIELHRTVRPELYREIMEKVAIEYLAVHKDM